MKGKAYGMTYSGIEPQLVTIEVERTEGLPGVDIAGLPPAQVKETRHRVRSALRATGFEWPSDRLAINVSPADAPKPHGLNDLAIAVAVLQASGVVGSTEGIIFVGELGLDGRVRPVCGAILAGDLSAATDRMVVCAPESAGEVATVPRARWAEARSLADVLAILNGEYVPQRFSFPHRKERTAVDLGAVRGQYAAKRALEIAAAGGHNMLMVGNPGTGKTLLTRALVGILPPITREEWLETTRIHSISGLTASCNWGAGRPFRAPHSTASEAALRGGGDLACTMPGEVSLANNGVLFLDEAAEFRKASLEAMLSALAERKVEITRRGKTVVYPADVHLVMASNPCPCGNLGSPVQQCKCTPAQVRAYQARLKPLLPVVDIGIELQYISQRELSGAVTEEKSEVVAARVRAAREIQLARGGLNSRMDFEELEQHATLTPDVARFLARAAEALGLGPRGWSTVVRIARTIADLHGKEVIGREHMAEALTFRTYAAQLTS